VENFRRACLEDHGAATPFALHCRDLKTVSIARDEGGRAAHATFVVLALRSNNAVRRKRVTTQAGSRAQRDLARLKLSRLSLHARIV
jgi:hypothetical protein